MRINPKLSRAVLALAAFGALRAISALADPIGEAVTVSASRVVNFRIASNETQFGPFIFLGGLELGAEDKDFGGISGIRLLAGRNSFLAVSDGGNWFAGQFSRDAGGALSDVAGVTKGPLVSAAANAVLRKLDADCEGIAVDGDTAYLSFERRHRIERVKLADGKPAGLPRPHFSKLKRLSLAYNKGIEALAVFPAGSAHAGSLLAIAEESLDANGNYRAFILTGGNIAEFQIVRTDDFAATDADFLPGGDLLLLERHFSFKRGPLMRIRRIQAAELAGQTPAVGEVLLEADSGYRIDNMEGIDVSEDASGAVFVSLISDDNYSALQSTLLLEFRLGE